MAIILAPLAVIFQCGVTKVGPTGIAPCYPIPTLDLIAGGTPLFFMWAAFVEEVVKLSVVYLLIVRNPNFDEPVDAMIYMMVAGLGFAAIENTLVLFRTLPSGLGATLTVWSLRAVGATLLHALSSSLIGYFLALSWFFQEHRKKLIILGVSLATLFHFVFNIFLSAADDKLQGLGYATGLLLLMAFLVSILFVKIRARHRTAIAQATLALKL